MKLRLMVYFHVNFLMKVLCETEVVLISYEQLACCLKLIFSRNCDQFMTVFDTFRLLHQMR